MSAPPTSRTRELETLLGTIRNAGNVQLNYEMWDARGREFSSAEEIATMEADLASARRDYEAATGALEALVAATRADAPGEIAAWVDAHDAYLAAFLSDCLARGDSDSTAAFVATKERAEWRKVREGTLAFVRENAFYISDDGERYRSLFGIDPRTLESVG